jgi:pimeloyl-ACP methyl ester carboxylesterase
MNASASLPPRLPYRVHAAGSGPFMFFVHGMLSSHRQWTPNLAALEGLVRPVLFDLWGHGDAPCPAADAAYTIEALVGEFERARTELGAERILLCGQSLGAALTLRYSILHPTRIIAQVFTNSRSALLAPEALGSPEESAARAEAIERGGTAALARLPFHPRHARRLEPALREAMAAVADATDPRAVARLMRIARPRLSVLGDLQRIACPTLLVNGRSERVFQPLRDVAERRIRGIRIADIAGGHAVNLENPEGFNAAVADFLRAVL